VGPILCIIPARGGSKGIPRKNVRPLADAPLIVHTIRHALASRRVDHTVVSTDDEEIAQIARAAGAKVVMRPAALATDSASSEAALRDALDQVGGTLGGEPSLVVFLQCTSPLRRPTDIDDAIRKLEESNADSLLSVVPSHRFLWREFNGQAQPLNYDPAARPRRQDREPEYQENGSIYLFRPWVLRECRSRLGGKIALFVMDPATGHEIDDPDDFDFCEWLLLRSRQKELAGRLPKRVSLIVSDFDGVFTDNRVLVSEDGTESVYCNRSDGLGIARLVAAGVPLVVLSTERNSVVQARAKKLGLECLHGIDDKASRLRRLIAERGIDPKEVVFVGNDVNDLGCFAEVGCAVVPADAHASVKARAAIVLPTKGGAGALRTLCDLVIDNLMEGQ
jgi:YrbI family 3-deoxy-D-manno-octulosonate 8-phosphate phosphatase